MLSYSLDISSLRKAYLTGASTPLSIINELYPCFTSSTTTFIYLESIESLRKRCSDLDAVPLSARTPLWGIPCAVKDNVDVAGMPTTAGCPKFQYQPDNSAPAMQALFEAGVIFVGKTNMDQFAAGLVGTRSPYGTAPNAFDHRFIPGGSSSGSGSIVGRGLVSIAIGTDTAGSGRVPAGLNGCVGMKGTVGYVSTVGVVPACASLDCLTVFAHTVEDGALAMRVMASAEGGPNDAWRRYNPASHQLTPLMPSFRFGVPSVEFLDWSTSGASHLRPQYEHRFQEAIERLKSLGGVQVEVDFGPLCAVAAMLYGSSFVAERYSGIRKFLEQGRKRGADVEQSLLVDERLELVTRHIISKSGNFSAADVFDDLARLALLKSKAMVQLEKADVLLVPTMLAHFTVAEIKGEEGPPIPAWTMNAKQGKFTNFVNLLDMCGVAVPSGLITYDLTAAGIPKEDEKRATSILQQDVMSNDEPHNSTTANEVVHLPFGVTLLAKGWRDEELWKIAAEMQTRSGLGCGPKGHKTTA